MQSLAVTAVAKSRMHTSLSLGRGSGTVLIWSTSGGPYAVQKAALIRFPQPAARAQPRNHRGSRCHCVQAAPNLRASSWAVLSKGWAMSVLGTGADFRGLE